jgi:hypothetical protein
VRLPQEAPQLPATTTDIAAAPIATAPPSAAASPEQASAAPSAAASAAAVIDLQSQLRDTQSSLASHLDKVRALEGVLAEQEVMKQEVRTLRQMMEERRLEREGAETAHLVHQHTHAHEPEEPRGGFDIEEDDEDRETSDDDSDDDAQSISTAVPHELERVEEEDEDQMAEEERRGREDKLLELEAEKQEEEDLLESEEEERERRREDLGLGRPRTPEPTRMGLDYPSLLSSVPRRASITSPLSQSSSEDVYNQVQKLSKQVTTVMALTTTLEAQHSAAQTTIQALESKVEALEGMLKIAEEALKAKSVQEEEAKEMANQMKEEEDKNEKESSTEILVEWKKSVEGQWGHVQEEWKEERERMNKAREEWEAKLGAILTAATANASSDGSSSLLVGNGDVFKHNGLVTPPSPRSQSSNSPRYRRRRRRASSRSPTGERGRSMSPLSDDDIADPDTDATLANSDEASSSSSPRAYSPELIRDMEILKEKHFVTTDGTKTMAAIAAAGLTAAAVSATGINMQVQTAARTLATPEPSVYKLSSSLTTVDESNPDLAAADDDSDRERSSSSSSRSSSTSHPKNFVASAHLEDLLWRFLLIFFPNLQSQHQQHPATASTAPASAGPNLNFHAVVGVLVLSVAAAAVFWKVKPE